MNKKYMFDSYCKRYSSRTPVVHDTQCFIQSMTRFGCFFIINFFCSKLYYCEKLIVYFAFMCGVLTHYCMWPDTLINT